MSARLTPRQRDILARTILGEAASEDPRGWAGVAHTIRNRALDERWPGDPAAVALQPQQFSAWNRGAGGNNLVHKYGPGDTQYNLAAKMVDLVFSGEAPDPTGGATHYYAPQGMPGGREPPWWQQEVQARGGQPTVIGNHRFAGRVRGAPAPVTPASMRAPARPAPPAQPEAPEPFGPPIASMPRRDPAAPPAMAGMMALGSAPADAPTPAPASVPANPFRRPSTTAAAGAAPANPFRRPSPATPAAPADQSSATGDLTAGWKMLEQVPGALGAATDAGEILFRNERDQNLQDEVRRMDEEIARQGWTEETIPPRIAQLREQRGAELEEMRRSNEQGLSEELTSLGGRAPEMGARNQEIASIPINPTAKRFLDLDTDADLSPGRLSNDPVGFAGDLASSIAEAGSIFAEDPLGVIRTLVLRSLPASLPGIAGGVAGHAAGPAGAAAGAAAGEFATEFALSFSEKLLGVAAEAGIDPSDSRAVGQFLRQNPDILSESLGHAGTRAGVVSGAGAVGAGVTSRMARGATTPGQAARRGAAAVGVEAGTETAGEGAAMLATGESIRPGEMLAEGVGGAGQGGAMFAGQVALDRIAGRREKPVQDLRAEDLIEEIEEPDAREALKAMGFSDRQIQQLHPDYRARLAEQAEQDVDAAEMAREAADTFAVLQRKMERGEFATETVPRRAEIDQRAPAQERANALAMQRQEREAPTGTRHIERERVGERGRGSPVAPDRPRGPDALGREQHDLPVATPDDLNPPPPRRMSDEELRRESAAFRATGNRNTADPQASRVTPGGLGLDPEGVQERREADQAFRSANRQRGRSDAAPETLDTRPAGRPEGGRASARRVLLDEGRPVRILEMTDTPQGRRFRVERYDPRTDEAEAGHEPYWVEQGDLQGANYTPEPRGAQEFEEAASAPPRGMTDAGVEIPRQTFRRTRPDEQTEGEPTQTATPGAGETSRAYRPGQGEGGAFDQAGGRGRGPYQRGPFTSAEEAQRAFEQAEREYQQRRARGETTEDDAWRDAAQDRYAGVKSSADSAGQDESGAWTTDDDGFVMSKPGGPIKFANQKQAARWIMRAQQNDAGQFFEMANHPTGGFTVREKGRNARAEERADEGSAAGPTEQRTAAGARGAQPAPAANAPEAYRPGLDDQRRPSADQRAAGRRQARAPEQDVDAEPERMGAPVREEPPAPVSMVRPRGRGPRTKALQDLMRRDARVIDVVVDPDGVFIYTDSAEWADDAGSGTFRGDTEAAAIRRFKSRVRRVAKPEPKSGPKPEPPSTPEPSNPDEITLGDTGFESEKPAKETANEAFERTMRELDALISYAKSVEQNDDYAKRGPTVRYTLRTASGKKTNYRLRGTPSESSATYAFGSGRGTEKSTTYGPVSEKLEGLKERLSKSAPSGAFGPDFKTSQQGYDLTHNQRLVGSEGPVQPSGKTPVKRWKWDNPDAPGRSDWPGRKAIFSANPVFDPAVYREVAETIGLLWQGGKDFFKGLSRLLGETSLGKTLRSANLAEGWAKAKAATRKMPAEKRGPYAQSALASTAEWLFSAYDRRMRRMVERLAKNNGGKQSPTATRILDMVFSRAGYESQSEGQSLDDAIFGETARHLNKLGKILGKLNTAQKEAVVRVARGSARTKDPTIQKAADGVRQWMNDMHDYLTEAGVELGRVKHNYLPREYDPEALQRNRDAFIQNATQLYKRERPGLSEKDARAMAEGMYDTIVFGEIGNLNRPGGSGMANFAHSRVFDQMADKPASEGGLADWMVNDLDYLLTRYVGRATKRAEIARRFGDRFSKWPEMVKQLREEGAGDMESDLLDYIATATGTRRYDTHRAANQVLGMTHAIGTMSLLEQVVFTSLPEVITPAIRSGSMRDAVGLLLRATMVDLPRAMVRLGPRARHKAALELAEDIGVIASYANISLQLARFYGGAATTRTQAKMVSNFFRNIGLTQFTDYTRARSADMASVFLRRMARADAGEGFSFFGLDRESSTMSKQRAAEMARELGVPAEKIPGFLKFVRDLGRDIPSPDKLTGENGKLYKAAVQRFVEQSIMRPNASMKPSWASTPLGRVIFALQSFGYAFHRQVLVRAGRNTQAGARMVAEGRMLDGLAAMSSVPLLALLPLFQFSLSEARDELDEKLSGKEKRPMTFGAKVERAVDRGGLLGALGPYIQTVSGTRYNRSVTQTLAGPVFGSGADVADTALTWLARNSDATNSAERRATSKMWGVGGEAAINGLMALQSNVYLGFLGATIARYSNEAVTTAVAGPGKKSMRDFKPQESVVETLLGANDFRGMRLSPEQRREIRQSKREHDRYMRRR